MSSRYDIYDISLLVAAGLLAHTATTPWGENMELMPDYGSRVVGFGAFEVDLCAGELRRNGRKVKIQNQPFQILAIMLERPGEAVTRDEMRARLWPAETFVDFDHSLNSAVKRLRDALGDSAEKPTYVETLARRDYRFIFPVGRNGSGSAEKGGESSRATAVVIPISAASEQPNADTVVKVKKRNLAIALAAVIVIVGCAAALVYFWALAAVSPRHGPGNHLQGKAILRRASAWLVQAPPVHRRCRRASGPKNAIWIEDVHLKLRSQVHLVNPYCTYR